MSSLTEFLKNIHNKNQNEQKKLNLNFKRIMKMRFKSKLSVQNQQRRNGISIEQNLAARKVIQVHNSLQTILFVRNS